MQDKEVHVSLISNDTVSQMPVGTQRAGKYERAPMNSYYCIFEVEPLPENSVIAHVSRAVVHIWALADDIHAARDIALRFLESDSWKVTKEKDAYLPTPEQIAKLGEDEASNYQDAQSKGIHARFYYWHRSE